MASAAPLPVEEMSAALRPYLSLLGALRQGTAVDRERTRLVEAAVEVWRRPGFDTFLAQPRLGFEPFDYQWQTAQTVLRRMRGRAIQSSPGGRRPRHERVGAKAPTRRPRVQASG